MASQSTLESLQTTLETLETEKNAIKKQYEALKQECNKLQNEINGQQTTKSIPNSISHDIWNEIIAKMQTDTEGIKQMIKNGEISMDDTYERGRTLLHYAASLGISFICKHHIILSIYI